MRKGNEMIITGADILRLAASGMTAEQIALVADILAEKEDQRKVYERDRKRKYRMSHSVPGHDGTPPIPPNGPFPDPIPLTPLNPPATHNAPAREGPSPFQQVFDAGVEVFPELVTRSTAVIHSWLLAGCDPILDIVPEIRRHAGRGINSWKFFENGIMDAFKTRTTAPPEGRARASPFARPDPFDEIAREKGWKNDESGGLRTG